MSYEMDTKENRYIWEPEIVGRHILPHVLRYIDSSDSAKLSPSYQEYVRAIETDEITYKRRLENEYNNGNLLGDDDPRTGYNVDWKLIYNLVTEKDWTSLFEINDNEDYAEIAVNMIKYNNKIKYINKYLIGATSKGHDNIVKVLMRYGADPAAEENMPIRNASARGHLKVVNILLDDSRVNPVGYLNGKQTAVQNAIIGNHIETVKRLIQDPRVYKTIDNNIIYFTVLIKRPIIAELLLNYPNIDPNYNNNAIIKKAIEHDYDSLVDAILQHPLVGDILNMVFIRAIQSDSINVFLLLINKHNMDYSNALLIAAEYNSGNILEILLQFPDVDPSINNNEALINAARYDTKKYYNRTNNKALKLLLDDDRVDPADQNNRALKIAIVYCIVDNVATLISDSRVDPSHNDNEAIITASQQSCNASTEIVKLLLNDSRVNPAAQSNEALYKAITQGNQEIIKLLLHHVDPSINNNIALKIAQDRELWDIMYLLIQDPRVRSTTLIREDDITKLKVDSYDIFLYTTRIDSAVKDQDIPTIKDILKKVQSNKEVNIEVIKRTFDNRNQEVQEHVLDLNMFEPSIYDNIILRQAAAKGNYRIMKRLLKDKDVLNLIRNNRDSYKDIFNIINLAAQSIRIVI